MLPKLPKQNKHREADFSILFRNWIKKNPRISGSYEIKDTRSKNYLSFKEVSDLQINYGLSINSDEGTLIRVQAINGGEPDYIYLRNAPAYIVIKYPKFFCIIDIGTFDLEIKRSKVRSLTGSRAKELSTVCVDLR